MAQALAQEPLEFSSEVDVVQVGTLDVEGMWPLLAPHLERAFVLTKKIDSEDARLMCEEGDAQLWAGVIWPDEVGGESVVLGAAITQILGHPSGYKTLSVVAMGGDEFKRWDRDLLGAMEEFAKSEGCHAIELTGRKGWGRWFPDYEPTAWTYSKELSDG